jgi:hypothetical protein
MTEEMTGVIRIEGTAEMTEEVVAVETGEAEPIEAAVETEEGEEEDR